MTASTGAVQVTEMATDPGVISVKQTLTARADDGKTFLESHWVCVQ